MATIIKRNKSYSVIYWYTALDGQRKQKWETFKSHEKALKRKEEIESPVCFIDSQQILTMEQLIDDYVNLHGKANWSINTHAVNTSRINNYIIPYIGSTKLSRADTYFLTKYFSFLRTGEPQLSEKSIKDIYILLHGIFECAKKWGLALNNPLDQIKKPRYKSRSFDSLSPEQVICLMESSKDRDPLLSLGIQLAFFCSLRKGELLALTWSDIDYDTKEVNIDKEKVRVSLKSYEFMNGKDVIYRFPSYKNNYKSISIIKKPKTESSVRKVFAPHGLLDNLSAFRENQKYKSDYIMTLNNGDVISSEYLSKRFQLLLIEFGLPVVAFHSIRHTSTSYKLKISGGDIKSVQADNGHSSPEMTMNVYAKISQTDRKALSEELDKSIYSCFDI